MAENQTTIAPPQFLDPDKALACIHCGLCLSSCPTYLVTGNENDSPRGRIYLMRAIQEGRQAADGGALRHIDLCLGCRACEAACPSGVQYGDLLEHTRDFIEHSVTRSPFQTFLRRIAIDQVFPFPRRFRAFLVLGRLARVMSINRLLPRSLRDSLELLPERAEIKPLPAFSASEHQPARGTVGLVSGCVMNVLFNRTNHNTVRLLNHLGYDVVVPPRQVCCGALYAHGGQLEKARAMARKNLAAFRAKSLDAVIINAAGCGSTLKEYHKLLAGDPAHAEVAKRFSSKIHDITEWLVREDNRKAFESLPASNGRVTYHDACHLAHPQGITQQPRVLIRAVAGDRYVELPEADVCCGSAGSYNLTEPAMAQRLQERKVNNIQKTEALTVVTTNPGCLLQIQAGLKKAGACHIRAIHLVDFLAERTGRTESAGHG